MMSVETSGQFPEPLIETASYPSQIELKETEFDGITYVCPTSEQMGAYVFSLAKSIKDSGQSFDRVIAIAKGGATWSRYLVDYLGMRGDVLSFVTFSRYDGTRETDNLRIVQPLPHRINGEVPLIFDEVADGGNTIMAADNHLREMGAADVKIATLCYKPRSKIIPDYHAFQTSAWVAFPHDRREFIEDSAAKWREIRSSISMEEVGDRLLTIGVLPHEVSEFLPPQWSKLESEPSLL